MPTASWSPCVETLICCGFTELCGGAVETTETHRQGQWVPVQARLVAQQTPTPYRCWRAVKRRGKVIFRSSQVGWVKVRLPGRTETLTMVVGLPSSSAGIVNVGTELVTHGKRAT